MSDLSVLGRTWGFNCSVYRLLSFNHAMCFQFLPYLELLWYYSFFFFNPLRRIDLASPQYLHYKQFISLCSLVITLCFPQVIWNLISYSFLLLARVQPNSILPNALQNFYKYLLALNWMKGYLFSGCISHKHNLGSSDNYPFPSFFKKYVEQYYYNCDWGYRVLVT